MILDNEPDVTVVGEAGDGETAVAMARALRPDVLLMDVRMPRLDGIEATARIVADPELAAVRTLVLTTFDDDEYVYGALRAGAAGSSSRTPTRSRSSTPCTASTPATPARPGGDGPHHLDLRRARAAGTACHGRHRGHRRHGHRARRGDPARARGAARRRARPVEPGDRRGAAPHRGHREEPRAVAAHQGRADEACSSSSSRTKPGSCGRAARPEPGSRVRGRPSTACPNASTMRHMSPSSTSTRCSKPSPT